MVCSSTLTHLFREVGEARAGGFVSVVDKLADLVTLQIDHRERGVVRTHGQASVKPCDPTRYLNVHCGVLQIFRLQYDTESQENTP